MKKVFKFLLLPVLAILFLNCSIESSQKVNSTATDGGSRVSSETEYRMYYSWTYNVKDEPISPENYMVELLTIDDEVIATVDLALAKRLSMEGCGFLPDGTLIELANDFDWPECRFSVIDQEVAPWGFDSMRSPLIPWKSITVDPGYIPLYSDVYIKVFDGLELPDGTFHNGWFKAVDPAYYFPNGYAIDIFTGTYPNYQAISEYLGDLKTSIVEFQPGKVHTVTLNTDLNGFIEPNNPKIPDGFGRQYTFTPKPGYKVDTVTVDGEIIPIPSNNQYVFKNVKENHSLDVTFVVDDNVCTASSSSGPNGTVTPEFKIIECGESINFNVFPDIGYEVDTATLNGMPTIITGNSLLIRSKFKSNHLHVTFKPIRKPVVYTKGSDWGTGFNAKVVITNYGTQAVNSWKVVMKFSGNQKVSGWNGIFSQVGKVVTVNNTNWNGVIPPGGTVSFGLNGSYTGENLDPTVTFE